MKREAAEPCINISTQMKTLEVASGLKSNCVAASFHSETKTQNRTSTFQQDIHTKIFVLWTT